MPLQKISQSRIQLALILGLFMVIAGCFFYIYYLYQHIILPEQIAKNTYENTICLIINKKLASKGIVIRQYRADFLVSYSVGGVLYKRWVSGNGLDTSYSQNQAELEDLLSQYEVGGTYRCWYDPVTPTTVLLVFRHNWISLFYLIGIPTIVSLLSLYLLINILFRSNRSKAKSEKRRRKAK